MKYAGGCHCGKVRYEVEMNLEKVVSCNCSICMKRGSLLDFVSEDQFKLLTGESNLTDYQFNKKAIHHLHCKDCGIVSFMRGTKPDGKTMIAVNVRCLDNVDLSKLKIQEVDGKRF